MNHYSHIGEILPVRGVIRPVPPGGILFPFDYGFYGVGNGRILYPLEGYVATLRPGEGRFGGGAVAVEEGTTNLIPAEKTTFVGWTAIGGASVTLTQGLALGTITSDGATRIQTSGGTDAFKYSMRDVPTGQGGVDTECAWSVWVKNLSSNNLIVLTETSATPPNSGREIVPPGKLIKYIRTATERGSNYYRRITFSAEDPSHSLDFIAYQPQIEPKAFPTSFVAGTRPTGSLTYPISTNMIEGTVNVWFFYNKAVAQVAQTGSIIRLRDNRGGLRNHIWVRIAPEHDAIRFQVRKDDGSQSNVNIISRSNLPDGWHMLTLRCKASDSLVDLFLDGEYQTSLDYHISDMLPFDTIDVGHRDGTQPLNSLLDGLLILPHAATQEEILSWYHADAPMVEPITGTVLGVAL